MNKKYFLILITFAMISVYALSYVPALSVEPVEPVKPYELSVPIPGEATKVAEPPQYILMIFRFSLSIAGLLALGMIIFGAIQYTTSAGNVARQQDAKDRITSAIYGIILLVGATLILTTINPDFALLKWEQPAPIDIRSELIKWGETFKKIMANYQARIKQLEEERARIEQERKLATANAKEAKELLDATAKDPNTSPKNLLALKIQVEEKSIAEKEKLVEEASKIVDINQTYFNRAKQEVYNQLVTAINQQVSDQNILKALQKELDNWVKAEKVGTPYGTVAGRNIIRVFGGGTIQPVELKMDQIDIGILDNAKKVVFQWGTLVTDELQKLNSAQTELQNSKNNLITYQNQLRELNLQQ